MDKRRVVQHLLEFFEEEWNREKTPELESLLFMYRFLPTRPYLPNEPIVPSSLVTLRTNETTTITYIAPRGGGFVTAIDGIPLQVLTPSSPLGEALLGKKTGDRFSVETRVGIREYEIISSI